MASELRVNSSTNRSGLGTITYTDSGPIVSGVGTFANGLTVDGTQTTVKSLKLTGDNYNANWFKTSDKLRFNDNAKATFGTADDLSIYHDGSSSFVSNNNPSNGTFFLQSNANIVLENTNGSNYIKCLPAAQVELYYNGSIKLTTTNTGAVVTGILTATTFSGAVSGTTGTFTGDVDIADKIVHTGDTNTAIRFPSADTITAEISGSERLRIDSSGKFCLGTYNSNFASNDGIVSIVNAASAGTENPLLTLWNPTTVGDARAGIDFLTNAQYGTGRDGAFIRASNDGSTAKAHLIFGTLKDETYAETFRITSAGNVVIGNPAAEDSASFQHYQSSARHQSFQSNKGDLSIVSDNNSNPVAYIKGTGTADLLNVFDNTSEVFTILDGGNTGLAVVAPKSKLHLPVNQDVRIGGQYGGTAQVQNEIEYSSGYTGVHWMFESNQSISWCFDGVMIINGSGSSSYGSEVVKITIVYSREHGALDSGDTWRNGTSSYNVETLGHGQVGLNPSAGDLSVTEETNPDGASSTRSLFKLSWSASGQSVGVDTRLIGNIHWAASGSSGSVEIQDKDGNIYWNSNP